MSFATNNKALLSSRTKKFLKFFQNFCTFYGTAYLPMMLDLIFYENKDKFDKSKKISKKRHCLLGILSNIIDPEFNKKLNIFA